MRLKELADRLGLSQTTVSRALNGYPEVAEQTRARVVAAARAAHYAPSGQAKSLATGRTLTIGHVIPVSTRHEMVNPVFGDFIAGASEVYAARGYDMLLNVVPDDRELQVYRDLHARGSVDGIVVQGPKMADRRIALLQSLGLPFVVHGRASEAPEGYCWVDVPNQRAVEEATRHLIGLGHRRIALVNGLESFDFAHRRRQGFEAALAAAGLAATPDWHHSADMTEPEGYAAARAMLAGENPPTAFVTASIITAIGVRRAVQERGLRLGRDVSVVTFDDALSYLGNDDDAADADDGGPSRTATDPDAPRAIFTALRSSVRAAGQRVAHMLLDRIEDPARPAEFQMMPTLFVPGRSTGPAPRDTPPRESPAAAAPATPEAQAAPRHPL
jgi:LacI family transcriptional regulator